MNYKLRKEGWIVLRFWEHEIKNNPERCFKKILKKFDERKKEDKNS